MRPFYCPTCSNSPGNCGYVADIVRRQFGDHDFMRIGVDAYMQLAPASAGTTAMLRIQPPFAFAVDFQTGAIHDQRCSCSVRMDVFWQDCQADSATTEGSMIWDGDVDIEHIGNGS